MPAVRLSSRVFWPQSPRTAPPGRNPAPVSWADLVNGFDYGTQMALLSGMFETDAPQIFELMSG